jgi:hypothetical protein
VPFDLHLLLLAFTSLLVFASGAMMLEDSVWPGSSVAGSKEAAVAPEKLHATSVRNAKRVALLMKVMFLLSICI